MFLYDTPGYNDSKLRFSNSELREKIKFTMLNHCEKSYLDAILIFESMQSESIRLRETLLKA